MLTRVLDLMRQGFTNGLRLAADAARRSRRVLLQPLTLALGALVLMGFVVSRLVVGVEPGQGAVRINRLTGSVTVLTEGWSAQFPGVTRLVRYPLREQVYHSDHGASAKGPAPFQSIEGLSVGADITVRYALDPKKVREIALRLPEDIGRELIQPIISAAIYRVLAEHNVREIFSTGRRDIEQAIEAEIRDRLAPDGVVIRAVFLGNVDLPQDYRAGMERLLAEELSAEKMRFTLELRDKQVKEAELTAEAEKVRRDKEAEAAGNQEIIAAKARAEAMKHILPFKEREIEQRRLEAEASHVTRLKTAEAEAQARLIEASGEADSRRKLAEAEAYRLEVTGKATSEQLAREGTVISRHPLLIQKAMADKLSDKIQVIIAPPQAGFVAAGLLGLKDGGRMPQPVPEDQTEAQPTGTSESRERR